jgi:4-diphosphocytidyl-2-C-methyl-D-erythritol kinase
LIQFPNCKINLGLNVLEKRADGFHNIASVFYPVSLYDVLELAPASDKTTRLFNYGLRVEGPQGQNLCIKAYDIIKSQYAEIPPVHIHLYKNIPMGAGLGGGSADGAFMLLALNKKFNLNIAESQLEALALELGSDCPFFILNKPVLATGRGELLKPITLNLSEYYILIVNPGIHVNTGWAFAQLKPKEQPNTILSILQQPIETWKEQLHNDFEKAVFNEHPAIAQLKAQFYNNGAIYASMTGSGSTVFGLFSRNQQPAIAFPPHYKVYLL